MYRAALVSVALMWGGQVAYAQCTPAAMGGVMINEIYPDAAGSDNDKEWVELQNWAFQPVDLSGWTLWAGTSSYNTSFVIPQGTVVTYGDHLHLGGPLVVPAADVVYPYPGLVMGNASSSCDAIQLRDCFGTVADTVVYGPTNSDGWLDDNQQVAVCAPAPNSEQALGRVTDGLDTDDLVYDFDWYPVGDETPGDANWFKIWADIGAPIQVSRCISAPPLPERDWVPVIPS